MPKQGMRLVATGERMCARARSSGASALRGIGHRRPLKRSARRHQALRREPTSKRACLCLWFRRTECTRRECHAAGRLSISTTPSGNVCGWKIRHRQSINLRSRSPALAGCSIFRPITPLLRFSTRTAYLYPACAARESAADASRTFFPVKLIIKITI